VTAAGYPGNAARYEKRLSGLLDGFRNYKKDQQKFKEFYVFGGECNYLFKYNPKSGHLDYIIEDVYQPNFFQEWSKNEEAIQSLLDAAEKHLQGKIVEMGLKERVSILRKSRAIGCNPKSGETLTREQLDELALSTQSELNLFQQNHNVPSKKLKISRSNSIKSNYELDCHIPFCAFNGGSDVWVDIGNKLIGVRILLEWLNMKPNETLHVGDQFLSTGNDIATRTACCTIWITSPQETHEMLVELIKIIEREL
jgi:IMP and pyridine-specific 5'-nucleotidase